MERSWSQSWCFVRSLGILLCLVLVGGAAAQSANAIPVTQPTKIILGTSTIIGGYSTTATVKFNNAPLGNINFLMSSDNPSKAKVPDTPILPAGSKQKIVTVRTETVLSTQLAVIDASSALVTVQATLTIEPGGLTLLEAPFILESFPSVTGVGSNAVDIGTVYLTSNATTDVVVELRSSNPGVLTVPATVTVLGGTRSADFPIGVAPDLVAPVSVMIRSRLGNSIRTTECFVVPGSI